MIIAQWRQERPDLDPSAKAVTGRIVRLGSLIGQAYALAFADAGLNDGDYGILVALRRTGKPYRLTPTELTRQRLMTSGGMTAAIDRLERAGLVDRTPNPEDRRGTLVGLTTAGRKAVDGAMAKHADAEHDLVSALSDRDREQLAKLLRKLLLSLE